MAVEFNCPDEYNDILKDICAKSKKQAEQMASKIIEGQYSCKSPCEFRKSFDAGDPGERCLFRRDPEEFGNLYDVKFKITCTKKSRDRNLKALLKELANIGVLLEDSVNVVKIKEDESYSHVIRLEASTGITEKDIAKVTKAVREILRERVKPIKTSKKSKRAQADNKK